MILFCNLRISASSVAKLHYPRLYYHRAGCLRSAWYKRSADILIVEALKSDEPHVYDYPSFYLYRHCLELYLKTIVDGSMRGHDFAKLVKAVEDKYHKMLGGWIRKRLWDFQEIDRKSDMFRYPEDVNDGELWIDFYHLKDVMDSITESFEQHLAVEGRLAH